MIKRQANLHNFAFTSTHTTPQTTSHKNSNSNHHTKRHSHTSSTSPLRPQTHNNTSYTSSLLQRTLLSEKIHKYHNHDCIGPPMSTPKTDDITRIYCLNINGIKLSSTGGEFNDICSTILSSDIDQFFAVEHNLDNTKSGVKSALYETVRKYFNFTKTTITGSTIPSSNDYKPGGVLSIARDSYSGRITKSHHDHLGRWIHHSLTGKNQRIINIVACYKVPISSRPVSEQRMTSFVQQLSVLKTRNPSTHPDPREHFDQDLLNLAQKCISEGQEILILGDFNENMDSPDSGIKNIMDKCSLLDIFHQNLGHSDFNTFHKGTSRIDFAISTPGVAQSISKCGYDPFSRRLVSDHRGFYLDFHTSSLFGNPTTILPPPVLRGLSSNYPETNRTYIDYKYNNLPEDFESLLDHIEGLTIPYNKLAEKLDRILTNASLYAELKCRRRKRPPLPKNILTIRHKYNFFRKCLSEFRLGKIILHQDNSERDKWPAPKPPNTAECNQSLRALRKQLREAEKMLHISMDAQIDASIDKCIRSGDKKRETEIRNLRKARETKALFSKLNKICKNVTRDSLKSIQVPIDLPHSPKEAKQWKTIDVPDDITRYLIERNRKHFGQADGTPFTRPPLSCHLNYQGSSTTAELLLEGDFQVEELDHLSNLFLHHMQRVTSLDIVRKSITTQDFISKVKNWTETTSTSPSGLHLSHYHALVKPHDLLENHPQFHELERRRHLLIRAHVALINYAVKFGYSYKRWQKIVNVMILKEPGDTRIHRLRVIHIYEADYNMINGIFWRRTIHHCEDNHLLHPGQYGGRPGRSSHDPVIIEEMVNEYSRATRHSNIKFANDAASCYDRILVNLASIFSRKYGCPRTVCLVMASNLQDAKYHLKTGLNVTEESYSHSALYPIHGSGQGSGNSPAIWTFISCSLFDMHGDKSHGAHFISFDNKTKVRLHMIGFVDDSTGYCLAKPDDHYLDLLRKMEHDAQLWSDILHISGGSLEFKKCLYHLTHFEFHPSGAPILLPKCSPHNTINLYSYDRQTINSIPLRSNYEDHKTLGYWKSPSGNQISQIDRLKRKSDSHARLIQSAPLNRREAWTYYHSIYLPSCTYSLPSSHLSETDLKKIQSAATRTILAKCGFNRNYPLAVIFGPSSYGGLSFRNLYYEQGIQQILLFLRHWRSRSLIGELFRVVLSWIQFQSGISSSILQDTSTSLPHLESKWFASLRLALHEFKATITLDNSCVPPPQRVHDTYIMDHVVSSKQFSNADIQKINYCRLYLQVITVSDISLVEGTTIDPAFLHGERSPSSSSHNHQQVKQGKPDKKSWNLWRTACQLFACPQGHLFVPLGHWLHTSPNLRKTWPSYLSTDKRRLLIKHDDTFQVYYQTQDSFVYSSPLNTPIFQSPTHHFYPVHALDHPQGKTTSTHWFPPPAARQPRIKNFHRYIGTLPPWKKYLLEGVHLFHTIQDIRERFEVTNLVLCSDGSVIKNNGSFGWVIATEDGTRIVSCAGPAFGCDPGDSFRAEAYGVLSWMVFYYEFCQFYNIRVPTTSEIMQQHKPYISAYTDNEGVIKRIETQLHWKYLSPACTLLADWDVINQICITMDNLLPPLSLIHIKGHQDDSTSKERLPLPAQLNIEADYLAGEYQRNSPIPKRTMVVQFPDNPAQLNVQGDTITSRYSHSLRFRRCLQPLTKYLQERNSWTDEQFNDINWDCFRQAVKKTTLPRQFINKLIHRHLPVATKIRLYDRHENDKCCFCNADDTQQHMFLCPHPDLQALRRTLYQRLRKKCDDLNTHPVLRDYLIAGLEHFLEGKEPLSDHELFPNIVTDQTSIGWYQLLLGRFHKSWAQEFDQHQEQHSSKPSRLTGQYWTTSIILLIWQWAHEYWTARNLHRQGKDNANSKQREHNKASREVKFLYDLKYKICADDRFILDSPLEDQLNMSTTYMNNWVTTWRPVLLRSVSRATTLAISHMHSIRDYFKPK